MSKTKNALIMIPVLLVAGTVGWHCVPDDLNKEANVAYDYSENGALDGGDYIFDGHSWNEWTEWRTDHELLTQRDGQILPIVPARGNHEASGLLFDEIWNTPGNAGENYWVTALSPS